MRSFGKTAAFAAGLCLWLALAGAAAAEDTQAQLMTALPTPTPEPVAMVALEPTAQPQQALDASEEGLLGDEAPLSPVPEPSPEPTPEPEWDESTCDHMNPNCKRAPICGVADCRHIGTDETGNVVALCKLGSWLLASADAHTSPAEGTRSMPAEAQSTLHLANGENTLYRSGSYTVSGGGSNATLHVRSGLDVALTLDNAQLLTLKVAPDAQVQLGFAGHSRINTVAAAGAALTLRGSGCLEVLSNFNCSNLTVRGGSVFLPASAQTVDGLMPHVFHAPGVLRVQLDGVVFSRVRTDEQGRVCLWLPVANYAFVQDGPLLRLTTVGQ